MYAVIGFLCMVALVMLDLLYTGVTWMTYVYGTCAVLIVVLLMLTRRDFRL